MNPYWNLNLGIAVAMAAATAAAIGPLLYIVLRRVRGAKRWVGAIAVSSALVVVLPTTQWIVLEPINKHLLAGMNDQARAEGLVGTDAERVRQLFGSPTSAQQVQQGREVWKYRRPWGYLLGSSFEIYFEGGRVVGWEAFDD